MPKPDFTLELVKDVGALRRLSETLIALPAFALDIETTDWWNRHSERIALVQIAFRTREARIKVAVIDTLAGFDLEPLRLPLETNSVVKIIHNAGFDAVRLRRHYGFGILSVFDTMLAARRSGERKYSLKAQAEIHLGVRLDKSAKSSDWSRRPLNIRQLSYAALDPYATLLLYENQTGRMLNGGYRLTLRSDSVQNPLPLDDLPVAVESAAEKISPALKESSRKTTLPEAAIALLGIIAELPTRYSPDSLAASTGSERVGLLGWIIDRRLGVGAEPDEETVKLMIDDLCEQRLIEITQSRRLQATEDGERLWQLIKTEK